MSLLAAGTVHHWSPILDHGVLPTHTLCGLDPRQFTEGDWAVSCSACNFIAPEKAQRELFAQEEA